MLITENKCVYPSAHLVNYLSISLSNPSNKTIHLCNQTIHLSNAIKQSIYPIHLSNPSIFPFSLSHSLSHVLPQNHSLSLSLSLSLLSFSIYPSVPLPHSRSVPTFPKQISSFPLNGLYIECLVIDGRCAGIRHGGLCSAGRGTTSPQTARHDLRPTLHRHGGSVNRTCLGERH